MNPIVIGPEIIRKPYPMIFEILDNQSPHYQATVKKLRDRLSLPASHIDASVSFQTLVGLRLWRIVGSGFRGLSV